ncbi:MAG: amidohydrolase family protein [Candidatus Dormibacteraceae bacterium]
MPVLERALLAGGGAVRVAIDGDRISEVVPAAPRGGEMLLLPAFIDTHVHLDKALTRDQLPEHDGTLAGAIGAVHERKRRYTVEDVRARARAVIEAGVLTGSTRFRSHVDIDTIAGLTPLEGVLAAARDCAGIAEVQTVAFPQEGILRDPGTLELMRAALAAGAGLVGGMPHWERTDRERREHVRLCFELAERFDRDLDMHVDETDDGSVRTLEMVADEALGRGWFGRVTAGHVCSLAAADDGYAARVIDKCARAGLSVVSNPVTNLVIQGRHDRGLIRRGTTRIAELRAAGVNLCFGQDCIDDAFYPFGRGDMLEVALISAHAAHLAGREELLFALEAVTEAPARAWRLTDHGIRPGARADLVLYEARSWKEALRLQAPPREVWFGGQKVAENLVTSRLLNGQAAGGPGAP